MTKSQSTRTSLLPASRILHPRAAFTLVELLVVITIIGILASLIVVAAVGALKKARETQIKTELNQISDGFEEAKNKFNGYPPNTVSYAGPGEPTINQTKVFDDLKRYLRQVSPRCQEPDNLIRAIVDNNFSTGGDFPRKLDGGMTAEEALVFWLGGFSSDPKYPISGPGGPSYKIPSLGAATNRELEDLSARTWIFPFEVARLGPIDDKNFFDESDGRFIEYRVTIGGVQQFRRINFRRYTPSKSKQAYVYFDTSRYAPDLLDPPAATELHVHALKKLENAGSTTNERVTFVNPDKFQVLHCGLDDVWGEEFDRTSYNQYNTDNTQFLAFPSGPFTGDVSDTIVNFATQTRLEDAQPQ